MVAFPMKRRNLLQGLAAAPALIPAVPLTLRSDDRPEDFENPYEEVDWDRWECLPSMSHQHQGQTEVSRELFLAMGYRHFAFSNYYPSAPTYPLPQAFAAKHPGVIAAPNAEQHSFTDSGLHANSLGSLFASGYGSSIPGSSLAEAPVVHRFEGLRRFEEQRPWEGVYRLDLRLSATPGSDAGNTGAVASLTLEGANACNFRSAFADEGPIQGKSYTAGNHTIYLRAGGDALETRLDYDPAALTVPQFRLMQGTNRPWREVFRAILDGEEAGGRKVGGLLHPDGGGITLNHPTGKLDDYTPMLDFDPRVLGIEVWNQLTSGFGSDRGFYEAGDRPPLHFHRLWDEILATGRRCWGFFVKDHNTYGRGRNLLLVPPLDGLSSREREAAALRAYRQGTFFGSVAAIATDGNGQVSAPYDHSEFRFRRLVLRRDAEGRPEAVEASVGGQDETRRPRVQIRFVTESGVALAIDGGEGEFPIPRNADGTIACRFVRVEAFAYPATHRSGEPLTPEILRGLDVAQIARLHDRMMERGPGFFGNPAELRTPLPIVDMIFSQAMRRV